MAAKPKPKPPQTPPGAPRWTYVLGALVGAGGLLWGIASFYLPKPAEPPRPAPAQQTATAIGGTAINASGDAKVSVGATTPTTAPALSTPTASAAPPSIAAPTATPAPPKPDAAAGGQNAQAGQGGIAVNAAGGAQVQVNNKP